ncbi:hypothetical protein P879_11357 [Paragonimus westermani]|uniref:Uncharacterized protein n=1 Tax=Paragonimus westermani TaxID=34504 RepID=A0A8T0D5Q2_9TREM|nr:hypothetical protein P879_11357 [Paragonimus westermani]
MMSREGVKKKTSTGIREKKTVEVKISKI